MANLQPFDDRQPVQGEPVICLVCGRTDALWYCAERQPSDNGSGQYLWKWTKCCGQFMKVTNG